MEIYADWTDFKSAVAIKVLAVQYVTDGNFYKIWAVEGPVIYRTDIFKVSPTPDPSDQKDFEDNFKTGANQPTTPIDDYGKQFVRAESRPLDMTTYFTTCGDDTVVGDGQSTIFNFNNTDNDLGSPPTGRKVKVVDLTFLDDVRIKEGTTYWQNMPYGSFINLEVCVPNNGYYYKNDGTLAQNTTGSPLPINRFVNQAPMMGDCQIGDELNTEAASDVIPAGSIFRLTVSVPDSVGNTDDVRGAVQFELYRTRTVTLT